MNRILEEDKEENFKSPVRIRRTGNWNLTAEIERETKAETLLDSLEFSDGIVDDEEEIAAIDESEKTIS